MRLQPVTQREHPFPSGRLLVSTTDLKGRILHANAVFVATSGYALNELLGQPPMSRVPAMNNLLELNS